MGLRNLKPGPSPLQALVRAGLGLGLDGLGLAGSGLEAQPSTSLLAGTASGPGATAYAHRKAYMYRCLSTECSEAYDIAKKKAGGVLTC